MVAEDEDKLQTMNALKSTMKALFSTKINGELLENESPPKIRRSLDNEALRRRKYDSL